MTKTLALEQIEKEFSTATRALSVGNDGMARVCSRRAAGIAITFWLEQKRDKSWGIDAMNKLQHLGADNSMPDVVREAAMRLTTKVDTRFALPFPADPIADSKIIISHFLQ
jgi:hypothetical protein